MAAACCDNIVCGAEDDGDGADVAWGALSTLFTTSFRRSFSCRFSRLFLNSSSAHSRFPSLSSLPKSLLARLFTRHLRSLSLSIVMNGRVK